MISVILPVYNEAENLQPLLSRLANLADRLKKEMGETFEFIFVDDASSDQTPVVLKEMHTKDKRVVVIRLAKNAGSHAALCAGLKAAQGNNAVVMAADLQDPPEIIPELLTAKTQGVKVVWGLRAKREKESLLTKICSRLYYFLVNRVTKVKMPPTGADVFLVDRCVIDAFNNLQEKTLSVFMTIAWLGFPESSISYVKEARLSGKSKWTLQKKFKLALDSILSFSDVPIRYMSVLGFITAGLGFAYALTVFFLALVGTPVEGWSSLIVVVLLIGGIQMMMLGFLGEYLWRTYDESRRRPKYFVEYKMDRR